MSEELNSKYYVGSPCKTCGSEIRYIKSKSCVECQKARHHARYVPAVKAPKERTYVVQGTVSQITKTLKRIKENLKKEQLTTV